MQKQHFRTDDDVDKYAKPYGKEPGDSGPKKQSKRARGEDGDEELRQAIELSK